MRYFLLMVACLTALCSYAQDPDFDVEQERALALAKEENILALQLYSLLNEGNGNMALSPYAISASMALVYNGVADSTEAQMARILHFRMAKNTVNNAYLWLNDHFKASPYYYASSLWMQKGELGPSFKNVVEKDYGATFRMVDFITRPDYQRVEINNWIKEKGQGKWEDVLSPRTLTSLDRIIVVSGAHIKGRWELPFDVRSTRQAPFFYDRYTTMTIPTMFTTGVYNYLEEKKFVMVEIPYDLKKEATAQLALFVLLPHEAYGLKNLENDLSVQNLVNWQEKAQKRLLNVSLPRFEITNRFLLNDVFLRMGMNDVFSDRANFLPLREVGDLKVTKAFHYASYSVDETGSGGGGGVAFGTFFERQGAYNRAISMAINRPFLFIVLDKTTQSILMIGRVTAP